MITADHLRQIMPRSPTEKREAYARHMSAAMKEADIVTVTRAASFLGQIAWESGELRYFEEIDSGHAYEGRKDLGNVNPGDGKRYKGRGPIQLTGRANYRAASAFVGVDLESDPEVAATPLIGFRVATWYWTTRELNVKADACDFMAITRAINGGLNAYERRLDYYRRALEVLGSKAKVTS